MALPNPVSCYISGPARMLVGAATIHSKDDIHFEEQPELADVMSIEGREDMSITDFIAKLSFTPMALWENIPVMIPAFYQTGAIGTRLVGAAQAWKIWASNGDLWNLYNAHVTKPPQLLLGADADPFGAIEVTAICIPTALPGAASATWDGPTAGQADPTAALDLTNFLKCRWTGNFKDNAGVNVAGFDVFEPYDHFTVDFSPQMHADKRQGLTSNWGLDMPGITCKCVPIGPTSAQIASARGVGNQVQGSRITKSGTLTLTSDVGNHTVTLKNMQITTSSSVFGKPLRNGEIGFTNVNARTAGVLQTLCAIV